MYRIYASILFSHVRVYCTRFLCIDVVYCCDRKIYSDHDVIKHIRLYIITIADRYFYH